MYDLADRRVVVAEDVQNIKQMLSLLITVTVDMYVKITHHDKVTF